MFFRRNLRLSSVAAIVYLFILPSARAAEFSQASSANGGPDIIFVSGTLTLDDDKRFIDAALNSNNAIVVFQSPGGNLYAGIEIGKAVRLKGFATYVPDAVQCASACALAWLGGRVRYMSESGRVGFHAAWINSAGQATVSSAGNALVGAYLNQLGLPSSAIVYITDAPPEGIQWLSFSDARRYGIDVNLLNLSTRPPTIQINPTTASFSSQVSSLKREVYEFFIATNKADDLTLSFLAGKYRDKVNYYGELLPKASVLNDKKTFLKSGRLEVMKYSQIR